VGQHDYWSTGDSTVEQPLADAPDPFAGFAPCQLRPAVLAALGDQQAVGVLRATGEEGSARNKSNGFADWIKR